MPALPDYTALPAQADATYVVMVSRLPLTRRALIPAFLGASLRIGKQLKASQGLVTYGLKADLLRSVFWTYSAWTDRAALDAMAKAGEHRISMKKFRPVVSGQRFAYVEVAGKDLPRKWGDREALLA